MEIFDDFERAYLPEGNQLLSKSVHRDAIHHQVWLNSIYQADVSLLHDGPGVGESLWHISFKRRDKKPVTNWRHKQWMKNFFCGDECTGFEVFPPESKLVDTANQYHIWVINDPNAFPFTFQHRLVAEDVGDTNAVQEPWQPEFRPSDLLSTEEMDNLVKSHFGVSIPKKEDS